MHIDDWFVGGSLRWDALEDRGPNTAPGYEMNAIAGGITLGRRVTRGNVDCDVAFEPRLIAESQSHHAGVDHESGSTTADFWFAALARAAIGPWAGTAVRSSGRRARAQSFPSRVRGRARSNIQTTAELERRSRSRHRLGRAMKLRSMTSAPAGAAELSADGHALAKVAEGNIAALSELYDRHASAIMKFAVRLVAREDAEDLVQATFVKAVSIAASYDDRSANARSWLFGIAAKLASERRRALVRFGRAIGRFANGARSSETPHTTERLGIERALAGLSAQKRVVLVLAEVEGYTCEQIGEMLGIPIGTVWTRLHHGRKELRALYDAGVK